MRVSSSWCTLVALLGTFTMVSTPVWGAGFALQEQSVSSLGRAFSNGSVGTGDASTVFFNPAGFADLEDGSNLNIGINQILVTFEFENDGSTNNFPPSAPSPIAGGDGGNAGQDATVPYVHYVYKMGDMGFGVGIYSPYGLSTKYKDDFVGRFHGLESGITTININPSFSYTITPEFTVGVGLNVQTLSAILTKAVDVGAACYAGAYEQAFIQARQAGQDETAAATTAATAAQNNCGTLINAKAEGTAEVTGDSTGYGFNIGFLYDLGETKIGLTYRSGIEHNIDGKAKYKDVANLIEDTDAKTSVSIPATASLGVAHEFGDAGVSFDILYTQWSVLDELKFEFDSDQDDSIEKFEWENAMKYSLGGHYRVMPELDLRFGLALDQSPIQETEKRGVRLPDTDRTWMTLGSGYDLGGVEINFAYAYLALGDAKVERLTEGEDKLVKGEYEGSIHIVGLDVAANF